MDKNGDFKESSKDKLNRAIASMCDEWLLIEEIDLEADTFEILHDNLQKQGIPVPRNCSYSQQNFEMQELVAPEYQEYRYNFGVRDNLRKLLKQSDTAECEYIVCTGENVWRRDVFKVVEWKDEEPKILNWFHMNIDSKKSAELKQRQAIRDAYLQSEQAYAIKNMYLKRLNEDICHESGTCDRVYRGDFPFSKGNLPYGASDDQYRRDTAGYDAVADAADICRKSVEKYA